jgi:tight adherence protein C
MSDTAILISFFFFVLGSVLTLCGMFLWRTERTGLGEPEVALLGRQPTGLRGAALAALRMMGEILPNPFTSTDKLRDQLVAAGYRNPGALKMFFGVKSGAALALGVVLGWVGLLAKADPGSAIVLALSGLGIGYLTPDRILSSAIARRVENLERSLPAALDLMVLSVEAGQTLDAALLETSRELNDLYPDLSSELAQVQLELRAGRSRSEVLFDLGKRTECGELKKLASVLMDTDRFGTSLGPALRTHSKYLRSRRRYQAQETARKLGVKLIFPVFFLVMPSVFVVTLGPALLQIYQTLIPMVSGANLP